MKTRIFLLIALAVFLFGCQSDKDVLMLDGEDIPAMTPRKDIELSDIGKKLSCQTNEFAFNLLKTVYTNNDNRRNMLLSPLSVTLALSMLNNGAAGITQEEIQQTLGYGDVSREDINTFAQKIVNAMQTLDRRGKFEWANSMWIQTDFPVINVFKEVNHKYYDAEIQNVDFNQSATLKTINDWVSEKTHEKIPTILDEMDTSVRVLLLNAIYFKGYWTEPFDKNLTVDGIFRTSIGTEQTVATMHKTSILLPYVKLENYEAVELPFGNGAFSLVVVLPAANTDISTLVAQTSGEWWSQIVDNLGSQPYEVHLEIPRFRLSYEKVLNDDLRALGMQSLFDLKTADFSLISPVNLYVSLVKQKTFAQMDEDGMEAAAVTVESLLTSHGREYVPVDFKVNRPFLYFIKEKSTELICFEGVMNEIK